MKIVIVSGGFDPLHSGHLSYIKESSKLGEKLIVCLNSDDWLVRKKGNFFLPFSERKIILESLSFVDEVISFDDSDGSCIKGIQNIKIKHPNDELVFSNGGDRDKNNIPEKKVKNIKLIYGVGGKTKKNSSSKILKRWNYGHEKRRWGKFFTLFYERNLKVKELIIEPNNGMSFQRHFKRNEIWFVYSGRCVVKHQKNCNQQVEEIRLKRNDLYSIKKEEWHQITNPYRQKCRIIEIQYGDHLNEDDIERLYHYGEKT